MEKLKSIAKIVWDTIDRCLPQFLMVFLFAILIGCFRWEIHDSRAGHQEVKTAAIVGKIYQRAVDDELWIPIDSNGTMMTIDTSTPDRFFIKLALDNKAIVKVKVKKPQFELLDIGKSVNLIRWVGQSGRVYRRSIMGDELKQSIDRNS
jgi:hypothetical protein